VVVELVDPVNEEGTFIAPFRAGAVAFHAISLEERLPPRKSSRGSISATFGTRGAKARGEDGSILCGARNTKAKIMMTSTAPAIVATITRYSHPDGGDVENK
jgi:hypothetical protein